MTSSMESCVSNNGSHIGGTACKINTMAVSVNLVNVALMSLGAFLTAFAYLSFLPVLAASLFYLVTYLLLWLPRMGGVYERNIFSRVFAVGMVASGIAAIYANYFMDAGQLHSDPASFFDMASGFSSQLSLIELQVRHEGSLAIVIWSWVYDLFAALGFPRERYVGIMLNITAVALTGVIALKITRMVYGYDPGRFRRLALLFSFCGLFWLFAGIHLRDSVVLLSITILAHAWLYFLSKPDLGWRLFKILTISLLSALYFGFLRGEFVFVPLAMAVAGTVALMSGTKSRRTRRVRYVLVLLGLAVAGGLLIIFGEEIQYTLSRGGEVYSNKRAEEHGADSLGMALIVDQPMPLKLVLGSFYLFVFPIPFWVGFQLDSVYSLFKSFNVLFFYFLIPLLVLSLWNLWMYKSLRTAKLMFMVYLSLGFTMAIAGTSLETRHFGAFLVPIFVLALQPDLTAPIVRNNYLQILMIFLGGVILVHLAWVFLKV